MGGAANLVRASVRESGTLYCWFQPVRQEESHMGGARSGVARGGPWRPVARGTAGQADSHGRLPVSLPASNYLSGQRRQCSCARVTERAFSIPEARAILIYAGGVARNEPFSCSSRLSSPKLFCHVNNALPFFLLAGESLGRVFESLYPGRAGAEAAKRQRPQRGSLRGHVSLRSFSAPRY